ncbi:MAG: putative cytokinetic ring protein SteA [Bacillota bacterium]
MNKLIRGRLLKNKKTKNLIPFMRQGDILLIDHKDIDEITAEAFIKAKVKAILNTQLSCSGKYPNPGPLNIVENGIILIDSISPDIWEKTEEVSEVIIKKGKIYDSKNEILGFGKIKTITNLKCELEEAQRNFGPQMEGFIKNTIEWANKELKRIFDKIDMSHIKTDFEKKHCLIVVRGQKYKEDLQAIRSYMREMNPVLVGVDGGADALLEVGFIPDLIVGDMDSVSDKALLCGAEIVVHAYPDGRAPGMERLKNLGLKDMKILPTFGTSEDVAMLLAFEKGAELIVAVGTHSNVIDFMEKGRRGMASTFLVRLKIGSILIDARGVNQLYRQRLKPKYLAEMVAAALLPFIVVFIVSPPAFQLARLIFLRLRLLLQV